VRSGAYRKGGASTMHLCMKMITISVSMGEMELRGARKERYN
jgi:hypothetical protein